ncbi:LCP family protein [Nocardioides bizhenqiangii]|uniref:LCP family protein n=1 Tax=Nocardioides bizhenqiangii TaxID=3095076 RepID=A0ABZ0ZNQ6_9ACTN|nr:LCP family protein [Nocardioides sp. HM61]WQQ25925.1 LCP family protein [Nocardioides sp. HM61]
MDSREDAPNDDRPAEPPTSKSHRDRSGGFIRRHKALTVLIALATVAAVVVAGLGIWVWTLNNKIDDIPRVDVDLERDDRPDRTQPKDALNVLLVGVDGRGTDVRQRLEEGDTGLLSDTMMIWHLEEDHQNSQVVSFPRDSWVDIPGYGEAKLNAAFSYGGPELLVQTLEDTLDIYIDHIAVVDFEGFKGITDTLGGVELETAGGGTQNYDGEEALEYVRERKSLPAGDFDRIDRQQNFLRQVLHEATRTGTRMNPFTVDNLIGDLGQLLVLDDDWSNGEIRDLGFDVVTQGAGDVVWMTAFNNGTGTSADGQSIVLLDVEKTKELMAAISRDEFEDYLEDNRIDRLPKPEDVP